MSKAETEDRFPVLDVRKLRVGYRTSSETVPVVEGADLTLGAGQVLALVGESGSGKTTIGQAVLGLLPANGDVLAGEIRHDGEDLVTAGADRMRELRGSRISLIPQDPTVSLNPIKRIGPQIADVLKLHTDENRATRREHVHRLLEQVGFTEVERRYRQYPHELSGGMRQRVLIAVAIAGDPDLIVADEPTSGLDVTVQKRILDLLDELRERTRTSMVLITHDLGVAADRSDRIAVMRAGEIVEQGETRSVIADPAHEYSRHLLRSAPTLGRGTRTAPTSTDDSESPVVLSARHLTKHFAVPGARGAVKAVDDVSFDVRRGQTLSIVGESGSGKSTTARMLVRLIEPTSGSIEILGTDVTALSRRQFRRHRRNIQIVYQNPYAAFDPRFDLFSIIEEPLRAHGSTTRADRAARVRRALEEVALPAAYLERKPSELSGGQRQRVAIARALVLEPKIVVLDEPVSALDVSVQDQILVLLDRLQRELDLSYVFISHDLAVVRAISDHVAVMNHGRVVEHGAAEQVFTDPATDYTAELLAAVPGRGSSARDKVY
ncbi:ABC transporter ATP-binding protein [Rhodococcus pseudokoreensis]|uniref:ABC transporter ATP-binding protein n=1 Tax=Rhodococcus pseudokoreensis TaxID=2811421 RepID=A0A974WD97_9NOCA|nr:ABC transporter ATP-binding protein [Rhodococcus pseudokoreensis]QSE94865.1 ABC transporter ATP-binding protein [Rhodococcus pseudokoreensis]